MTGIFAERRNIDFKRLGTTCTIPNSSMACLMYYLQSVDSICNYGIPSYYKNYNNYNNLSFELENAILSYAILLEPKIFIQKNIFINDPSLCGNSNNQFYEITDSRTSIAATREFVIHGKRVRTLKIMAYKDCWMEKNYNIPMQYYSRRIQAILNGNIEDFRPKPVTYVIHTGNINYSNNPRPTTGTNHSPSTFTNNPRPNTPGNNSPSCCIC